MFATYHRTKWLGLSLVALVTSQACVDDEVKGKSAKLLLLEGPSAPVAPGERVRLAFQSTDEVGSGVPDQRLEVLVSDLTRLTFADKPNEGRILVLTGKHVEADGVTLEGGAVVELAVPITAKPGSVTVIGSLEGERGAASKTRWVEINIGEASGIGGEGGMSGMSGLGGEPPGGTGGGGGAAGAGGAAGSGGASGAGGAEQGGGAGDNTGGEALGGAAVAAQRGGVEGGQPSE